MQAHRERDAFRKLGAQVVVVGHSSLRYATAFVEETKIELPVFVDEKRVLYKALEFKRPILTFLTPKVFKRAAEARKAGFNQPGVHGDAFQLGGVVLQMPDGSMPFKYASQFAGDHPKIEDLLAEVRKAIGG
ncbi:MAG: AhpC/TSA family protein [Vicinamibacteria bacterium]|nr:AhpC/TSA family protein [Vicinamibacteria bacterium]